MIDSISFVKFKTLCVLYRRELFKRTLKQQLWFSYRPVGLVVWFSLRVREVPGSTPGQAHGHFLSRSCDGIDWYIEFLNYPIFYCGILVIIDVKRKKAMSWEQYNLKLNCTIKIAYKIRSIYNVCWIIGMILADGALGSVFDSSLAILDLLFWCKKNLMDC